MFKKKILFIFSISFTIFIISWSFLDPHPVKAATYQTPTLFIHGYLGTKNSTNHLITASTKKANATKVLTATVSDTGQVTWSGKWKTSIKRPLIQVIFNDNQAPMATQITWLTNILQQLKSNYQIKNFQAVSHSAGSVLIYQTITTQTKLPKLTRWVTIAGPFDGVIGMNDQPHQNQLQKNGKPTILYPASEFYPSYQTLIDERHNLPKQLSILNVYGNLNDGTDSDGQVTNVSALSLGYLVKGHIKHYQTKLISGVGSDHSGLHNNQKVDKAVTKFLWR